MTEAEYVLLVEIVEGKPWLAHKRLKELLPTLNVVRADVPREVAPTGQIEGKKDPFTRRAEFIRDNYPEYHGPPKI